MIDDGLFEFWFLKEQDIKIESNGMQMPLPQAFSIGRVEQPSKVLIPNRMTLFTIKLQPYITSFFVTPNSTSPIELLETRYPGIARLHTQIFDASSMEERIGHVESFFSSHDLPTTNEFEISKKICSIIHEKQGDIKVKDLVTRFPYSRQKLNQLFLHQTKSSIKDFATRTRLRAITSYQMDHPEESLTSISYQFGYFDQSHFIKDMKKFTGVSPSEFSKTNNLYYPQIKDKA